MAAELTSGERRLLREICACPIAAHEAVVAFHRACGPSLPDKQLILALQGMLECGAPDGPADHTPSGPWLRILQVLLHSRLDETGLHGGEAFRKLFEALPDGSESLRSRFEALKNFGGLPDGPEAVQKIFEAFRTVLEAFGAFRNSSGGLEKILERFEVLSKRFRTVRNPLPAVRKSLTTVRKRFGAVLKPI